MIMSRKERKLDRLKMNLRSATTEAPICAVPMHAPQTSSLWQGVGEAGWGGVLKEGTTKAILKACQGGYGESHFEVLTQRLGCCGHDSERKGTFRQKSSMKILLLRMFRGTQRGGGMSHYINQGRDRFWRCRACLVVLALLSFFVGFRRPKLITGLRAFPSPIQTWKVNVALYKRFEKVWHFVTFRDISNCHNVTLLNFVTSLGFCHTVCIFLSFLAQPKMWKKRECHAPSGPLSDWKQLL